MTKLVPLVLTLLVAMTLPSMFSELPSQAKGLNTREQTFTRGDSDRRPGIETPNSGSAGRDYGDLLDRGRAELRLHGDGSRHAAADDHLPAADHTKHGSERVHGGGDVCRSGGDR